MKVQNSFLSSQRRSISSDSTGLSYGACTRRAKCMRQHIAQGNVKVTYHVSTTGNGREREVSGAAGDACDVAVDVPLLKRLAFELCLPSPLQRQRHLLVATLEQHIVSSILTLTGRRTLTQLQIQSFEPTYTSTRTPRSSSAAM